MNKKPTGTLLLFGSLGLIVAAIAITAVINGANRNAAAPTDIRAKAGITATLKVVGIVTSVDNANSTVLVDGLRFSDSQDTAASLGSWTVTPPPSYNLSLLSSGARVTITVDPSSFLVATHTLSATQITVSK